MKKRMDMRRRDAVRIRIGDLVKVENMRLVPPVVGKCLPAIGGGK